MLGVPVQLQLSMKVKFKYAGILESRVQIGPANWDTVSSKAGVLYTVVMKRGLNCKPKLYLYSNFHLWSRHLGSDQKSKVTNTRAQMSFLHRVAEKHEELRYPERAESRANTHLC